MDKQLNTISFEDLLDRSSEYLRHQQEVCKAVYKIDTYKNWSYNQATGRLTFSDDGVEKLIIDYEAVGSVSLKSNTWLWSWANSEDDVKIKSRIELVRNYGEQRQFEKLIASKWDAKEIDGWEMTCISAYLMDAKGAYRVPVNDKTLFVFMIFKEIHWPEGVENDDDELRQVDCKTHGLRRAAFVCQHLQTDSNIGFHEPFESQPGGDGDVDLQGWCDQCEAVRAMEGEWNDKSEAFAAIKLVCDQCFFEMKRANRL